MATTVYTAIIVKEGDLYAELDVASQGATVEPERTPTGESTTLGPDPRLGKSWYAKEGGLISFTAGCVSRSGSAGGWDPDQGDVEVLFRE